MKYIYFSFLFSFLFSDAQVKIHAHNDYEKPIPFYHALKNSVYSIEADIFNRTGHLFVAHQASHIDSSKTLDELYIKPIVALFKKNKGRISKDKKYRLALMIDIKESGEQTIRQLAELLNANPNCFDRSRNAMAVQVIISGDRGNVKSWNAYPSYLLFDGRPTEQYDQSTLERVALISDSYAPYVDNKEKIKNLVMQTHQKGKLLRFWGTPDNEASWKYFRDAGVDIINTDKPERCRLYFENEKQVKHSSR